MKERSGYGDADARRILERAAEIDVERGRELDATALREIATQAGISPLAVDRALEEQEAALPTRVPWWKQRRALLTMLVIAAVLVAWNLLRRVPPP